MKYRKKPIVIEAVQWTGKNYNEIFKFYPDIHFDIPSEEVEIHTLEGNMIASKNDWIIKGIQDEFYPCKPDIFEETYEIVKE